MGNTDSFHQLPQVDNYEITGKISETRHSIVFQGKDKNNEKVSIKVLKTSAPTSSDFARFRQEYNLIKNINLDSVIKIHDIMQYEDKPALVFEYCEGKTLKETLKDKINDIKWFLTIATKLSETLGKLHTKQIVHKDIKPGNILVFHDNIKLIDFGISKEITHENEHIYDNTVIEGTLPYISPEQTGRMNRSIDYRTDLYSMGITFYEMLTGSLPFASDDPMEIIHSHIAKEAAPPHRINPPVPEILSKIVMKLLSKAVEDRYQNSFGVLADLNKCLEMYNEKKEISGFKIAEKDISLKFNIPQILVGRQEELETLMDSFERISREALELVLVSGQPGIGKSVLIHEIHRPVVAKKGYFISGKYDQFRRNVPYSAVIQAFKGLVGQILAESDERLEIWQDKLLKLIGGNGKVITDLIPDVELIIGRQQDVPVLDAEAAQNRFMYVFKNFMKIFASKEHPLVLFLDDIQWADAASLNLIHAIMNDKDFGHLLLIIAFRDNEITSNHIAASILEEIQSLPVTIRTINVNCLDAADTNTFVSNFLRCDKETSQALGELIYEKTRGNPFFINQFMKSLYENRMIYQTAGGWERNIDAIREMQISENVVELLASQINTQREDTREVLKICSCIGNMFDLETLVQVADIHIEKILAEINTAIEEGFISLRDKMYTFCHDRIQEAAYSLIPDEEREIRHYQIGNMILDSTAVEDLDKNILYIVNQINSGKKLITDDQEKLKVAELNLRCARKSIDTAAYDIGHLYITVAIELLGEDCWIKDKDLSLSIYTMSVKTACLNSDFEMMEKYSETVEKKTRKIMDRLEIYAIKMRAYMAQDKKIEAVKTVSDIFKGLNINLPESPNKLHIIKHLVKVKRALKKKSSEDILNMPEMTNPEALAGIKMLMAYSPVAYWVRPKAVPLIVLISIELTLEHGLAPESAYFFNGLGLIFCAMGKYDEGYAYSKLGLSLIDRVKARDLEPRTRYIFSGWTQHWKEKQRTVKESHYNIYKLSMEIGDFEFAAHALATYSYQSFFCGMELESVDNTMSRSIEVQRELKQESQKNITCIILQAVHNLSGKAENPCILVGEIYNEKIMFPIHKKSEDSASLYYLYLLRLIVNFFFNKFELAIEYSEESNRYISMAMKATNPIVCYNFYDSLARIGFYKNTHQKMMKKLLKKVLQNQKMMKKWAQNMESNYMHKYCLVEAELARIKGDNTQAIELYDNAIRGAHTNDYVQDEALAHELAALFWKEQGNNRYASMHLRQSLVYYTKWGAAAKVDLIREEYPELLGRAPVIDESLESTEEEKTTKLTSGHHALDLSTVIKATQALSGEIVLEKLLKILMQFAMENAGAQHAILFFENQGRLFIEAESDINGNIDVLKSIPSHEKKDFAANVVGYVLKTSKNIVLHNACEDEQFSNDPYIYNNKIKSILCTPILHKGKISGIVYLENNLTTDAFTPERLEILNILASQAAISIENANLYNKLAEHRNNLEDLVKERTLELEAAQKELVEKAHKAGMADIASGTLHNVGNILNSLKTSFQIISSHTNQSAFGDFRKANDLLRENINTLDEFITSNPKGKKLMSYYLKIEETFETEQNSIAQHFSRMSEKLNAIEDVVSALQNYAGSGIHTEDNALHEIVDSALTIQTALIEGNNITIEKDYHDIPETKIQKMKLMYILTSLIENAKDAMMETQPERKTLKLAVTHENNSVFIKVSDSGRGIAREDLTKIFHQEYTTKKDRQGNSLHNSANYMVEMNGKMWAESGGIGKGSDLILRFPVS